MRQRPGGIIVLLAALFCVASGCGRPRSDAPVMSNSGVHPTSPRTMPQSAEDGLFRDVAATAGLHFTWGHPSFTGLNILETIGHGCAFLDYDGDGRLDVLLVGNAGPRLFRNRGDGTFEDVSAAALPKPPAAAHFLGCAVADYDGDGRPDIFLSGYGVTALYHNEGNGAFRDVTTGSGLEARGPDDWTTSAAWADVDGDGKLDLYVCRYVAFAPGAKQLCSYVTLDGKRLDMACSPSVYPSQVGSLYHNEGHGRFRDITQAAGLGTAHGNALGCMFCDFNADGHPDLYVANDEKPGDLFLNLGSGRFRNLGVESTTAYSADGTPLAGMGVDWGDYDGDGRFDLLVSNFADQPKSLFHNEGRNLFTDRSYASGLGVKTLQPLIFGASFVDVENAGLPDVVFTCGHVFSEVDKTSRNDTYRQATLLFRNLDNGRFVDASPDAGADFARPIVGRGIAVGDYDGDGRLDLLVVDDEGAPLLLHNEAKTANHWLSLRCLTRGGRTDAVGALITVKAGGRKQIGEVRASGSYLSTNAPDVHFGLGAASRADRIEIQWSGGGKSAYRNVAADRAYRVTPDAILSMAPAVPVQHP